MCLSASQVSAFGQAAVRLERTHSRAEGRSLSRRKLYMLFVCSQVCHGPTYGCLGVPYGFRVVWGWVDVEVVLSGCNCPCVL